MQAQLSRIQAFQATYLAEILLQRGKLKGSVFLQWGWTPLHMAARSGSRPIVELLLDEGVNAEVRVEVWFCSATVS